MIRLTHLASFAAFIALVSCTSKSDNAADTTAAMTDTSAAAASAMPPDAGATAGTASTASTTSTTSTTASSTGAITKIDLNTATDAQILAIPGVGQRMLREFKEYRPYTSMDQFRREIGKYVDKAEVARLEQYVTIK
jgi:DNA uptake protein ComE-like DNA-binding protein